MSESAVKKLISSGRESLLRVRSLTDKKAQYLCQCACFIREDVLNLPQFLIEGCGSSLGWRILLVVVHLDVPVDPQAMRKTDYFNTGTRNHRNLHKYTSSK